MILTTTDGVDGKSIVAYLGIVSGDAVMGANVFRDLFASIRDVIGGRASSYETLLQDAKQGALEDLSKRARALGADAVVGIDLDYEAIGKSMLMVVANGTAVKLG
ncbi:MAG: YbjQ family protein [Magnetospirillum sp.]|nr:YbjQ family protein [Magnetospirillum sp.]